MTLIMKLLLFQNQKKNHVADEISNKVKFPSPPIVSTSKAVFTPYDSVSKGLSIPFCNSQVQVHVPNRLYTFTKVFSPKECEKFIASNNFSYVEEKLQKNYLQELRSRNLPLVRTNMRRKYIDENVAQVIWQIARENLPKTLPDGRKLVGVRSAMNFFKYSVGEYFTPHLDGGHSSTETGHSSEYTFVVYLNDDFQGGSTRFCGIPELEGSAKDITPVQGNVTILRQSDMKHCGVTLKAGYKYILQGMIMYGPVSVNKLGRPVGKKANIFTQVDC